MPISVHGGAVTIAVRVTPRAAREQLSLQDGHLRVHLRAAPVDGAANAALIVFLASSLGMPRSAITIAGGGAARMKRLQIAGITSDALRRRLASALSALRED